jgi:hypothetical protein
VNPSALSSVALHYRVLGVQLKSSLIVAVVAVRHMSPARQSIVKVNHTTPAHPILNSQLALQKSVLNITAFFHYSFHFESSNIRDRLVSQPLRNIVDLWPSFTHGAAATASERHAETTAPYFIGFFSTAGMMVFVSVNESGILRWLMYMIE